MRAVQELIDMRRMLAFNSLFEMRRRHCSCDAEGAAEAFNSLFEMRLFTVSPPRRLIFDFQFSI